MGELLPNSSSDRDGARAAFRCVVLHRLGDALVGPA
jgi:hypothetical protein